MLHKFLPVVVAAVIVGFIGLAAIQALDPYPAPRTVRNMYSKLVTDLRHQPPEETQVWYINQILAQVANPQDPNQRSGVWDGQDVSSPASDLAQADSAQVLSADIPQSDKWIDVNVSTQTLMQMEGDTVVNSFKISSGVPWHPTPIGDFTIWLKVRDQTMVGGSKAAGDYYYLPHVHNISYFSGGYGIHAAYWHHNFGHPMSHGCINMTEANAATIFNWDTPVIPDGANSIRATQDNPGTRVHIHT